ncbi:hypothetical protein CDD81_6031 [Ophiocordyceps australis]|uniref:Uncharacterized protein n=1 Tax=Ophiocordyceps australis TaxID=1399860 RepID=A0A2C5XMP4_9HYPO|nr:hypothetical protein CDD81_6031 [Ophiocordyceps australis]
MTTPPEASRHSRNSSFGDDYQRSPQVRRRSNTTMLGTASPSADDSNHPDADALDLSVLAGTGSGLASGMGNLADELADAFSDFGEEYEADGYLNESEAISKQQTATEAMLDTNIPTIIPQNSKVITTDNSEGNLNIPSFPKRGHHRKGSEYDGSEYGSESDFDSAGMSPTLVAKIDAVESLARRGTESYGGPAEDVFKRVTDGLRDLGSQSTVEGSTSRLITAHSALTTHLAHQTRLLQGLTFPLLSPLAAPLNAETIEDLLPLLLSLTEDMPRPCTAAFSSLVALQSITSELIQTLSYLSDTLHMSRQTTVMATRRLKSAKELVAEMRREEELREEGERWLAHGKWSERLQKRECAVVCGEVMGGFEAICDGWRQRLLAQAESQA